jgi:hypothetical protein
MFCDRPGLLIARMQRERSVGFGAGPQHPVGLERWLGRATLPSGIAVPSANQV